MKAQNDRQAGKELLNIGVDVGGTNIKFGVVDPNGKILFKKSIDTKSFMESAAMLNAIIEEINQLTTDAGIEWSDINSIGIGFPGTVEQETGIVVYAPNIQWRNVAAVDFLKNHFDKGISIIQDSRASAWGEFQVGSGVGYSDMVSITLGTGIGCGMIIGGSIYHGGLNTAGEFGHHRIRKSTRQCTCGRMGCLETYIGGPAIIKLAIKEKVFSGGLKGMDKAFSVSDVYEQAAEGNERAILVANKVVEYLGTGLLNLINIMSPQLICLSGGISNAPDHLLLNPLMDLLEKEVYEPISKEVRLVKSLLGSDAPLIGAALLYRNKLL